MTNNQTTTSRRRPALTLVCSLALLISVVACGKKEDGKTVGQTIDAGLAKTEQMAKEAKDKATASMASAGDAVKQAASDAQSAAGPAVSKVADKMDDVAITAAVSTGLAKDPDLSAIKINVETKNGVVTLNGPAPTAAAKAKAADIAKQIQGVTSVNNQLVIKAS